MGKRDRLGGLPSRALNIGLIVYGSLDNLSGGYLYDRKLVEYLRRQGDRVEIIAQPWRNYAGRLAQNFRLENPPAGGNAPAGYPAAGRVEPSLAVLV